MRITECKTNHMVNPMGYKMDAPIFSYKVEGAKGEFQAEARIRISVREDMSKPFFDTGFDKSIDSLAFKADIDLLPRTRYYWSVCVHSDIGEEAESEINWFETGKQQEDWNAQWITCNNFGGRNPIFSKGIPDEEIVREARLYVCGLGLYEVAINGEKVSDEYLTPYCNNYNKWLQYQTYDVTEQIKGGGLMEIMLGNGWYKGRFGHSRMLNQKPFYSSEWKLIAELHILCGDGRKIVIGTDEEWKVRPGNITESSIYDGEIYDATLGTGKEEWAILCQETMAELTERLSPPVKVREEITPLEIICTPSGETVIDLGQNIAGIFRLKVNEVAGKKVHLQFGEILQNGNFYRDNLRTAKAEYIFISDGKEHNITPHFTYYGYRYVKVDGIENMKKEDFTGLVLFSELPKTGTLTTGHHLVNQLIQNIEWGQKGNFIDVPTDCPQRDERMGWTGDAQVFSPTACFLRDSYGFFRKYLHDIASEQEENDGKVPDVIPSVGNKGTSAAWGDAACIIPWNLYQFYGDKSILEEQYDSMKAWVDYIAEIDGEDNNWRNQYHYGDWLALDHPSGNAADERGKTDVGFIASVYYAHSAELMAKTAEILNKKEEAIYYKELSQKIFQGVKGEYYSRTERCCIDTQTALLMTLRFNLVENREKTREALRLKFKESHGKLNTGFVGTPILCTQLAEEGMGDIAYKLLLNEEYPGWLHEVKLGATTVWERWNSVLEDGSISSTGMNSLNHYAYGSILEWLYRYSAGLNPIAEAPGFRKVRLVPSLCYALGFVDAEYDSAAGKYKVGWKILDENHVELHVTVPFGCEAELILPMAQETIYREVENPIFGDVKDGVCRLKPGEYLVAYETTDKLRKIYSTYTPICELLENSAIKAYMKQNFNSVLQMPASMHESSIRQIVARYGGGDTKMYDEMDRVLAEF